MTKFPPECPVCRIQTNYKFELQILRRYNTSYYSCPTCGLVKTEKPYWLNEAYQQSITDLDIGLLKRNLEFSKKISIILFFLGIKGKILDYAGGYGVFCRLMRDIGWDFLWADKYSPNLFAKNFEHRGEKVSVVTALEVIEHFEDPNLFMKEILQTLDPRGTIIISTELVPENLTSAWWYLIPDAGQHVTFHSKKSLEELAKSYGFHFFNFRSISLFSNSSMAVTNVFLKISLLPGIRSLIFYFIRFSKTSLQKSDFSRIEKT